MLRAFTDRKFEYSRFACLHAAREGLKRYLALRSTNNTQGTARVVDFATTIASATLILNQVGCAANPALVKHEVDDELLVIQTVESMRVVSRGPREFMARQGVEVIETLLAFNKVDQGAGTSTKVRLTIPFFGPINIQRNSSQQPPGQPAAARQFAAGQKPDGLTPDVSNYPSCGVATNNIAPTYGRVLSFDHTDLSEPGWLPPLEAWDFDNVPDWGDSFGLWDVSDWNT